MILKKVIPNLGNRTNYALHYRELQLYFSLGIKLTKIHKVLKFRQSDWMKKYIDFNTEKGKNAANSFEKDFFKIDDQFCLWQNRVLIPSIHHITLFPFGILDARFKPILTKTHSISQRCNFYF